MHNFLLRYYVAEHGLDLRSAERFDAAGGVDLVDGDLGSEPGEPAGVSERAGHRMQYADLQTYLPDEILQQVLNRGVPQYTQRTLTSPAMFLEDMQRTREQGFAISEQEYEDGINAIAAPIFNTHHVPIASISVAGPAYRLSKERMMEIGPSITDTAKKIAQEVKLVMRLE